MATILVTGGLGFIGSHTVIALIEQGYTPIILDNLSNSRKEVLNGIEKISRQIPVFIKGDVLDAAIYESIFEQFHIDAVVHFAAYKAVGESVEQPLKYYLNNVVGLVTLLQNMKKYNCKKIVFSSSCTVYGQPETIPVTENTPFQEALSPYGATKQMCERILRDQQDIETQCLRYFNPVGAHPSGYIGELPLGVPSNLIPYLTQSVAGLRAPLVIHGNDYNTPDGTCIRDYIHVVDLANAHVASLKKILNNQELPFEAYNIGTGMGSSVLEVIQAFEIANNLPVSYQLGPRRAGDIEKIFADTSLAEEKLLWKAKFSLPEMMRDAWNWQQHLQ